MSEATLVQNYDSMTLVKLKKILLQGSLLLLLSFIIEGKDSGQKSFGEGLDARSAQIQFW